MKFVVLLLVLGTMLGAEPAQHKQVTVPTKTLDRYVGQYTMPGVIMKVTRETSHLFIQENDKPRTEIFPENEFLFFQKASENKITFEGISRGKAIIMMIHADGKSTPLARIQ
jgi:hypothetical protein